MIKTKNYLITRERLLIHELIGLQVEVAQTKDPKKKGLRGRIVDETQHTFKIETAKGEKIVPKNECAFTFELGEEKMLLDGSELMQNPIERLKSGGRTGYA